MRYRIIKDAWVEKIWEGTATVLALDMVRAASKPGTVDAFVSVCLLSGPNQSICLHTLWQWANSIISSYPANLSGELSGALDALRKGLDETRSTYVGRLAPLASRPALMVFSHVTSALYLLEHAVWASTTGEPTAETDVEVFRRWVDEGGLHEALQDLQRAKATGECRSKTDTQIVYGVGEEQSMSRARPGEKGRFAAHL